MLVVARVLYTNTFSQLSFTKTLTKYERKRLQFWWASLFIFGRSYFVRALAYTGCGSHFRNPAPFNILKKPLLVLKQTIHQQKALYFSFNLAPWKWAWHHHEAATPSCPKITFFTPRAPMLFAAGGRGALLVMPRPFSECQIKAEIKGFPLMYRLFLY